MKVQIRCMLDSFYTFDIRKSKKKIQELKNVGLSFDKHPQDPQLLKQQPGYGKMNLPKTLINIVDMFGMISISKEKGNMLIKYSPERINNED